MKEAKAAAEVITRGRNRKKSKVAKAGVADVKTRGKKKKTKRLRKTEHLKKAETQRKTTKYCVPTNTKRLRTTNRDVNAARNILYKGVCQLSGKKLHDNFDRRQKLNSTTAMELMQ